MVRRLVAMLAVLTLVLTMASTALAKTKIKECSGPRGNSAWMGNNACDTYDYGYRTTPAPAKPSSPSPWLEVAMETVKEWAMKKATTPQIAPEPSGGLEKNPLQNVMPYTPPKPNNCSATKTCHTAY